MDVFLFIKLQIFILAIIIILITLLFNKPVNKDEQSSLNQGFISTYFSYLYLNINVLS